MQSSHRHTCVVVPRKGIQAIPPKGGGAPAGARICRQQPHGGRWDGKQGPCHNGNSQVSAVAESSRQLARPLAAAQWTETWVRGNSTAMDICRCACTCIKMHVRKCLHQAVHPMHTHACAGSTPGCMHGQVEREQPSFRMSWCIQHHPAAVRRCREHVATPASPHLLLLTVGCPLLGSCRSYCMHASKTGASAESMI